MSASTDYTGRTVDILIFQGVKETGDQLIDTSFGESGYVCTGVQKISQSWTALFMTDIGSMLNKPTRGSGFLPAVRRGRIQVEEDIPSEFSLAAEQVRRTMGQDADDAGTLPDDERLEEATLLDYALFRDLSYLRLKVRIKSVAGDTRVIYLPIPIPIS